MSDAAEPEAWPRAMVALSLLAIDPGLGGITVRGRVGPVLRQFEDRLAGLPGPQRRIHPDLSDTQLFGGPDIAATLAAGRLVTEAGLAATPCTLVLPMAERTPAELAARLAQILDAGQGHALVMQDEGATDDERAPAALTERLAFFIDLDAVGRLEATGRPVGVSAIDAARARLPEVTVSAEHMTTLVQLAARFAISSLRAPLFALRAARAHAALSGRNAVADADLRVAVELVYPSRAEALPLDEEDTPPPPPPPPDPAEGGESKNPDDPLSDIPEDLLIEAIAALLPSDLLERLKSGGPAARQSPGQGAGARKKGGRRGRPLPARPGKLGGTARIDLVATLRAAAPWQPLRRRERPTATGIQVRPSDIRLRRVEEKANRLLIFCVDASGSSAMARLGEAKGAVEILLAQSYAKRDEVALIAFRKAEATLLLPPTRSLVRAKRSLAALPGGGGTPLAAALDSVARLAIQAQSQGLSPTFALLTDGRANIALDGSASRDRAQEDTERMARHLRAAGLPGIVIDTTPRPGRHVVSLAQSLGASHLALPRADAGRIAAQVLTALAP